MPSIARTSSRSALTLVSVIVCSGRACATGDILDMHVKGAYARTTATVEASALLSATSHMMTSSIFLVTMIALRQHTLFRPQWDTVQRTRTGTASLSLRANAMSHTSRLIAP